MPVTEELITEVDKAIDNVISENKEPEEQNVQDEVQDTNVDTETTEVLEETNSEQESEITEETDITTDSSDKSKEETAEKVGAVQPAVSDQALYLAAQAGIPISEAREFKSDEMLLRVVASIDAAKEEVKPKEEEDDPFAAIPKLDPEKYEDEVIELFNSLVGVVKKQHEELKGLKTQTSEQVKQSTLVNQKTVQREMTEWFDERVDKLGPDFQDILGKGSIDLLETKSPQYAKRDAIANQIAIMMAGYNASGRQMPSRDKLFDSAARLILQDEYQKLHEKKLTESLKSRSTQHINRVSSRSSKASGDPFEEAAAELDAKYFRKK